MNKAGFARQFFCITENTHDVTSSQRETVEETTQGQTCLTRGEQEARSSHNFPTSHVLRIQPSHVAQEAKEVLPYGIALQAD